MQKSNDLLGKKLKEAKKRLFQKHLDSKEKNNQKNKKSIKLQQPHQ